jgi:hypothetical protein
MWHVWGRREVHIWLGWGNLMERDHFQYLGIDARIILEWVVKIRVYGTTWTGMIWLGIGINGRLF